MKYFYLRNGQEYGPFTVEELKNKEIDRYTELRSESMHLFSRADSFAEVAQGMGWRNNNSNNATAQSQPSPNYNQPTQQQNAAPYGQQVAERNYNNGNLGNIIMPTRPSNYKILAFISLWFGLMPFGVLAMFNALMVDYVYDQGDFDRANKHSRKALTYSLWAFAIFLIVIILCIIFFSVVVGGLLASNSFDF